jgi:hypothetical protein
MPRQRHKLGESSLIVIRLFMVFIKLKLGLLHQLERRQTEIQPNARQAVPHGAVP